MTLRTRVDRPDVTINAPLLGSIRITEVRPIVDSEPFQHLRGLKQLGPLEIVYVMCGYSRFAHSLYVFWLTKQRMERLVRWGVCTKQDQRDVEVAALFHDTGHGPGSHLTDRLVGEDHNDRSVRIAMSRRQEIEECDANFDRVIAILKRTDPLAAILFDTPLGADKLAYLKLDSHEMGFDGMPAVDQFFDFVYFEDGKLVVDQKIEEQVRNLIAHFIKMYRDGYYRKAVAIIERLYQRNIAIAMGRHGEPTVLLKEEELLCMSDDGLADFLRNADNEEIREHFKRLRAHRQHRAAVTLQPHGAAPVYVPNGKALAPRAIDEQFFHMERLLEPETLYIMERWIERMLSLPHGSVLVTPPVPIRRFKPPTIWFKRNGGSAVHIKDYWPDEYQAWERNAASCLRFHVCAWPEFREQVFQAADRVTDAVVKLASTL